MHPRLFTDSVLPFLTAPTLPYTAYNHSFTPEKYKHLNPGKLKFKQCVREDLNLAKETRGSGETIVKLDTFFPNLERQFPEGILEDKALEEILPVYMECRIELLRLAKAQELAKEVALNILASKLPHIHAYCETDLNKVLKYRLKRFENELHIHGFQSQYLSHHNQQHQNDDAKIQTHFKIDGSLYMEKRRD